MGNAQTRAGVLLLVETSKTCLMNLQQHNNSMDVRARTATFLSRCPLNFGGHGGGFAPRHLSRLDKTVILSNKKQAFLRSQ